MFIAALFPGAKRWTQSKCAPADEWRNKLWQTHMTEYYAAIRKNEIQIQATLWMKLENALHGISPR
uniref:Uncharacterized protein n=1 Tax=Mustela putorius furo TaxID=9669 RepID=M3YGA0_MUSPF